MDELFLPITIFLRSLGCKGAFADQIISGANLSTAIPQALSELAMASNFHIQKPYVLATLPTPLQRAETRGRCSVGVVYGQRPGPKKRTRRSELVIGIDGDAVNLYDVRQHMQTVSNP
jgi:hypothetical protein